MENQLTAVLQAVLDLRNEVPPSRAVLVALSGIDGCGKGYVCTRLERMFSATGLRTAMINIDGWLNLPEVRFGGLDGAEYFYDYAIRFDDMFSSLVLPLRDQRTVKIEMDYLSETSAAFEKRQIALSDIDIILLEGIFLFKQSFRKYYDLTVWIDCPFEVALERAISRCQEGLDREATIQAYETIFHRAQKLHLERDQPRSSVAMIIDNS